MKNLTTLLKQTGKVVTSFIAYDEYRTAVTNDINVRESDKLLQDTLDKYNDAVKQTEERQDILDIQNSKVTDIVSRLQEKANLVNKEINFIRQNKNDINEKNVNDLDESVNSLTEEIIKLLLTDPFDTNNKDDFNIDKIWETFNSLNTLELGAVTHICSSIVVISCLWYIVIAYFGDQLINYFKLEKNYPKLSVFIKYRKKFQQYYIISNTIIITIILLSIMYVDVTILIYRN